MVRNFMLVVDEERSCFLDKESQVSLSRVLELVEHGRRLR